MAMLKEKGPFKRKGMIPDGVLALSKDDPIAAKMQQAQETVNAVTRKQFVETYSNRTYLATTQNLSYILHYSDRIIGKAFTILGSGDSVFQLVYCGVEDITAVDVNQLQIDVFLLRKAAVKALSYDEFYYFCFDTNSRYFLDYDLFLERVYPNFDAEEKISARFWKNFLELNKDEKDDLLNFFFKGGLERMYDIDKIKDSLGFMKKKKDYEKMKRNLAKAKIKVHNTDALTYLDENTEVYDWIDISNVLVYSFQNVMDSDIERYKSYLKDLKEIKDSTLDDFGVFVVDYMFGVNLDELSSGKEVKTSDEKMLMDLYQTTFGMLIDIFGELCCYEVTAVTDAMPVKGEKDSVIYLVG